MNSDKPSAKKSPAKKMSPMKPAGMSKKQVDVSATKKDKDKSPAIKKVATLKNSPNSSEGAKTRAASNRATLDSLMAEIDFNKSGGGAKRQVMGMPVKDFSESAVAVLLQNKVENEKVLKTAARAMSAEAFESKDKTLSSLARFQEFFTEKKTSSLLSPEGARLLGHAEDLDEEANAVLQALLLVSAMNLAGKNPYSLKLAPRKSIKTMSKADVKKRLLLISTMAEILHHKSKNTAKDKKMATKLAKFNKDLNKIVADF